jgi:hypothetical protein
MFWQKNSKSSMKFLPIGPAKFIRKGGYPFSYFEGEGVAFKPRSPSPSLVLMCAYGNSNFVRIKLITIVFLELKFCKKIPFKSKLFNTGVAKCLETNPDLDVSGMIDAIVSHCEEAFEKDVASNKAMGQFGANHILAKGTFGDLLDSQSFLSSDAFF